MTSRAVVSHQLRLIVTLAIVMLLALGAIGQRCATLPTASATVPATLATLTSSAMTTGSGPAPGTVTDTDTATTTSDTATDTSTTEPAPAAAPRATRPAVASVHVDVQLSPPGCGVPDDAPTDGRDITLAGHGWATAAAPDDASPALTSTTSQSPVLTAFGHEPLTLTIIALCISRT